MREYANGKLSRDTLFEFAVLVIQPIIALMQDQMKFFENKGLNVVRLTHLSEDSNLQKGSENQRI